MCKFYGCEADIMCGKAVKPVPSGKGAHTDIGIGVGTVASFDQL